MEKLEENAIEILHMICSNSPGIVSDSGGKDSSVLKHIAMKAHEKYGFQFSIRHNHTTVDAPETVYFVREDICLNPRYKKKGVCRVGCIGCPMAGDGRWEQFREFPTYKQNYIRAFDRMLIERERRGLENRKQWETGLKVFKWWMEDKNMDGQLAFDEMGQIYEQYTDNENYR